MKNLLRKSLSLALSLSLLVSLPVSAHASQALGEDLTKTDTLLNQQTELSTNVFWSSSSSDFRTENLITYRPNTAVTPIVTYGGVLTEKSSLSAAAKTLESQGRRVVAGINGDFYVVSSGVPVGLVITEGQLRSSDGECYAIGFRADGTAVLGRPQLSVSAAVSYLSAPTGESLQGNPVSPEDDAAQENPGGLGDLGGLQTAPENPETGLLTPENPPESSAGAVPLESSYRIAAVNKGRNNDGIYLYTYDFNARHTTGTTQPGVDVVCSIQEGRLSIGESMRVVVDRVLESSEPTAIGQNQIVLTANAKAPEEILSALRAIPAGAEITLSASAGSGEWDGVEYACGALYSLVENGTAVTSGLPTGAAPRTAVGQKADGSLVFYTIDGRRSGHSVGASMTQTAARMAELGCVTALCLDGGGSTTLAVTKPNELSSKTINRPSDGAERQVSNQIFLVASSVPTGTLSHFYVTADHPYVLAGSKVNITASAVDTNFIPLANHPYDLSSDGGELAGNVLTTPLQGGDITVTAGSGGMTGEAVIHVVADPDGVTVRDESGAAITTLSVAPGSATKLSAAATYRHTPLHADQESFTWSLAGDIGEIDQLGNFTASNPGSGVITVTAGAHSASVAVTVSSAHLQTVEDFEGETTIFRGGGANLDYSLNRTGDYVKLGKGSGKLSYTLSAEGGYLAEWRAANPTAATGAPYTAVNLWIYGDASGAEFSLLLLDDAGNETAQRVVTMGFTGWQQVTVPIPTTASIRGLRISAPGYGQEDFQPLETSGTVYLDQITATYDGIVDGDAPSVTASLDEDNWQITGTVADGVDGTLPASAVTVSYNGNVMGNSYDAATGQVCFALPGPGETHEAMRITVTAKDASGNIGRASVDVAPYGVGHKFTDIEGYWAADYVDFLYNTNVTTGYEDGSFRPDQNITRAQFSAMLYRYLKLDETKYAEVQLPFADLDRIPSYALPAIRALYAEGIVNGSAGSDGLIRFNPSGNLTRAQAAAMIGRTQDKGYAVQELAFTDGANIPSYAAFYIQTMTAQGILSGYSDGTFRPGNNITRGQMAKILYNLA